MSTAGSRFVVRKRQERGERRIESIIAAAAELFAAHGIDGTSMNAIAHASDLGIGSLYQYFPNKDAIVEAIADEYVRSWRSIIAAVVVPGAPLTLRELVRRGIVEIVGFTERHRAIGTLLAADPQRGPSIRAIKEEFENGIPVLALIYPQTPREKMAPIVRTSAAIIRCVGSDIAGESDAEVRRSLIDELTTAVVAYIVARLGESDAAPPAG
jgi:AcrR family transcriptional regulator